MSKRVHFASTNTIYETGSATPSPSLTASSLPSSSSPELLTPPPPDDDHYEYRVYPRTPYAKQADLFPEMIMQNPIPPMQIHFLLAYAPYTEPALHWDMTLPPASIEYQFSSHAFSEPATSPPMSSLIIYHSSLKYEIEVVPPQASSGAVVTVSDVLTKLYRELRLSIHPIEYADLKDEEIRKQVDNAYYARCSRIHDRGERLQEQQKGIKKIDFLMGSTRFLGLSGTMTGPDIWELNAI